MKHVGNRRSINNNAMSINSTISPSRNLGTSSRPLSWPTHFEIFNNWRVLALLVLLLLVALPSLVLYRAAHRSSVFLFPLPISSSLQIGQSARVYDDDEFKLVRVLNEAAMVDGKTVILTTLNGAWAAPGSIIDLFLESFRIGEGTKKLLKHLVIIALDQNAYARCLALHTHCFALTTDGVDFSQEAYFMTASYLKMMWRRIEFLKSILEMGYNFVFTDADIMWLRDPFHRFFSDTDFQIACDYFIASPYNLQNKPNGGFYYAKSNNRTIAFYSFWYSSRETYPGYHDQDVLNIIKYDPLILNIGLKLKFLPTFFFGGFCEPSKMFQVVCTMHANCCFGLESKLHDLKITLEDWRNYMSLPLYLRNTYQSGWRVPQNCSLEALHHHPISADNVELGPTAEQDQDA